MAKKKSQAKEEAAEANVDPLHEHREDFKVYLDAWKDDRQRYVEDLKFVSGEQWHEKDKNAREAEQRPCLTVDKLNQYVKQVVNDSRQNRPGIKVRPVDSGADVETANIFQGLTRHIEDRSNADTAYDTALECAVKGGFGFFRILREFSSEKSFNQELRFKRIRNPLTVLYDPNCVEPDGSDAKKVYVWEDMECDEFKATYPDAKEIDFQTDGIEKPDWFGEKKVRVAECYWVEETEKAMHLLVDGSTASEDEIAEAVAEGVTAPEIVDTRKIPVRTVMWGKFNGKEYLEGPKKEPGKWIPIVPVWGNEVDIEGKVIHTGMIHPAKDAQRLYNYSRTASAERLSKPGVYVAADGQIAEYESDWDGSNRNVAVKRYTPMDVNGTPLPPPRFDATDIPSALVQDMQISEHDIQGSLGMYNASLGEKSNEKSGRAIVARQREGDMANFHYHDNLARAIRHAGRILVDLIPKIYDTKRVVRVLGLDGKAEMVEIDPEQPQAMMKVGSKAIYNLGVGEYDVSVTVGPSYTTQRQEAAESMAQMFQGSPELMQLIGDIFFRNQDWPGAEDIADRLKMMLPPQMQEAEKSKGEISPEVLQVKQQAEQALAQKDEVMAGAVQKIEALMQENEALKASAEQAALKAQQVQIKAAGDVLSMSQDLASAELKIQENEVVQRITQMTQEQGQPEQVEAQPQMDIASLLQAIASMQQPQAPINITVPVTVDGKGQTVKQGRAIRQADGSYVMESVETPVDAGIE